MGLGLAVAAGAGALLLLRRSRGGVMLSLHFSIAELTRTSTGIPNEPSTTDLEHLRVVARELLEPVRSALGAPLYVASGYRSEAVNDAVGGASGSAHLQGWAADVYASGWTSEELASLVYELHQAGELPELGECIWYDSARSSSLHLAHRDSGAGDGEFLYGDAEGGYVYWTP